MKIKNPKYKTRKSKRGTPRGFTMVEIVVMLAIVVIISAIVLANFPSVSGSINVQKTAQRFALALREAQNRALSVRVVQGPLGPVVPPAVGVNVAIASPTTYIVFADMNSNKIYDAASDIIIERLSLEKTVSILDIQDEASGSQSVVNIVFSVPEAMATIYNVSGSIGESALIRFRTDAGNVIRSVRVRTSGQIATE